MSELYLAAAEKDLSAFEVALAGGAVTGGNDFAIDSSTQITGFLDDTLWDLHWVMDGIEPFILLETIANNNPDDGIVALQELFNHHFGLNGWNFEKCLSGEEVFDGV